MIIFVADTISDFIYETLKRKGYVVKIKPNINTYAEIANHPDVQVCSVGDELFIDQWCYNQLSQDDKVALLEHGKINELGQLLGKKYPESVRFNGVYLGDLFIHNLKHTAKPIKEYLEKQQIRRLQVNQGYTGCNTICLIDKREKSRLGVITEDEGISKELADMPDVEVLLIPPGEVQLKGFSHGFIGGSAGIVGDTVYFNGCISQHSMSHQILSFVKSYGYHIIEDLRNPLVDCGSILTFGLE